MVSVAARVARDPKNRRVKEDGKLQDLLNPIKLNLYQRMKMMFMTTRDGKRLINGMTMMMKKSMSIRMTMITRVMKITVIGNGMKITKKTLFMMNMSNQQDEENNNLGETQKMNIIKTRDSKESRESLKVFN